MRLVRLAVVVIDWFVEGRASDVGVCIYYNPGDREGLYKVAIC